MEDPSNIESILSLSVEELFALLDSPNSEVAEEARSIIKDELKIVKEKWLISGLIECFHATNSKRLLDILIAAPEPHDRYFLDQLYHGLKGPDPFIRFRCAGVILHVIISNPMPIWIYKIPSHSLYKEILNILSRSREIDISVVVSCCLILYFLLPNMPTFLIKDIDKILASFFCLLHWSPSKETDNTFKPYLQVAVYSLFHRLYSLFPSSLISYIKSHINHSHMSWYHNTLKPMLEQVRLHPLLFLDVKDGEFNKKRWFGISSNDIIHECSKLCLDPLEEICEVNIKLKNVSFDEMQYSGGFLFTEGEGSFWSPSVVPSPSTASMPATPIYLTGNRSATLSESPPETAIEATPETTPFTSPLKLDSKMLHSRKNLNPNVNIPSSSITQKKDPSLRLNIDKESFLSKGEKSSIMSNKLQDIQKERVNLKEPNLEASPDILEKTKKESHVHFTVESVENSKVPQSDPLGGKFESRRRRKASVYEQKPFKVAEDNVQKEVCDDEQETPHSEHDSPPFIQRKSSEDSDISEFDSRRNSSSSQFASDKDEGLGVPSHKSMNDLVRSGKTNRLRFLSQCGPPPDLSLLYAASGHILNSPKTEPVPIIHRSKSFPDLLADNSGNVTSTSFKKDLEFSASSLSPMRPQVETIETATQTAEPQFFDSYEKIFEALLTQKTEMANCIPKADRVQESYSPHQILELLLERECKSDVPLSSELGWSYLNDEEKTNIQSYLRIMFSTMMLERQKRDAHAERNRSLFGKIKGLNSIKVKETGAKKEIIFYEQDVKNLKSSIATLQSKEFTQERVTKEAVPINILETLKSKEEQTEKNCEKLQETCISLQKENHSLAQQLKQCQKELKDKDRQLKLHVKHVDENKQLQREVEILQKQLLLASELNVELKQQIDCQFPKYVYPPASKIADDRAAFERKIEELEETTREAIWKKGVAEQYHAQLKKELADKEMGLRMETERVRATEESWKERCDALAKRNVSLCNINITQMRELQDRTPTQERVADDSRMIFSGKEGSEHASANPSSNRVSHSPIQIPTLTADSYLAQNFSDMHLHYNPRSHD